MITHIVLFKLKTPEEIKNVREMLLGLKDTVPVIRHLEAGIDVLRSHRSYDIALSVKFDSLSDLEAYQVHPEHVKVAEYIAKVRDSVVVVDYESA
ncbi:MAG: Dabb family protein [Deltaproteobacteria bacterium]|nr:Dabb family protein [Deltaproteobacteria bacterium]